MLLLLLGVHADMRTALGFTIFLGAQGTLPYIMCMLRARLQKHLWTEWSKPRAMCLQDSWSAAHHENIKPQLCNAHCSSSPHPGGSSVHQPRGGGAPSRATWASREVRAMFTMCRWAKCTQMLFPRQATNMLDSKQGPQLHDVLHALLHVACSNADTQSRHSSSHLTCSHPSEGPSRKPRFSDSPLHHCKLRPSAASTLRHPCPAYDALGQHVHLHAAAVQSQAHGPCPCPLNA